MLQGQHEDRAKGGDDVKHGGIDVGVNELHGVLLRSDAMMRGVLAQGVSQCRRRAGIIIPARQDH
jgi:hypothetical protein